MDFPFHNFSYKFYNIPSEYEDKGILVCYALMVCTDIRVVELSILTDSYSEDYEDVTFSKEEFNEQFKNLKQLDRFVVEQWSIYGDIDGYGVIISGEEKSNEINVKIQEGQLLKFKKILDNIDNKDSILNYFIV